MNKKQQFLHIFRKARNKYGKKEKRLAAEGWKHDWQILITTIMSAQSRDETTIPIAENLFKKYKTIQSLANAKYSDVLKILRSLNYNKTKSKNIIKASQYLVKNHKGKIPNNIEELTNLPGVGRKTANLVISEVHKKETITVDTHVHRISNVIGLVKTKNPHKTEIELQKIAPKRYWNKINRLFVLWGKDCPGQNKEKLLKKLKEND
jgi:endonuclease III